MAETMAPDCRRSIIEVLAILSSPERQLAYERNVPQASVPNELISMWFDDSYLPESKAFRDCFSAGELAEMAAFNQFYDAAVKELPEACAGIKDWLNDRTWRDVTQRARDLLAALTQ